MSKAKIKRPKKQKMLVCDDCHQAKPDVQVCYDPYMEEVCNKKVLTQLCGECYRQSCMDI